MKLDAAYVQWSNEPFPQGSTRDDIDELHADLATVDHWVMGIVVPYFEDGARFPLKVDIRGGIQRIRDRAHELYASAEGEDRALLDLYLRYIDRLDAVFQAFQAESHSE